MRVQTQKAQKAQTWYNDVRKTDSSAKTIRQCSKAQTVGINKDKQGVQKSQSDGTIGNDRQKVE